MEKNSNNRCPICNGLYHDIALSFYVCQKHLKWFVTYCGDCGKYCFSDCIGICPGCLAYPFIGDWSDAYNFSAS